MAAWPPSERKTVVRQIPGPPWPSAMCSSYPLAARSVYYDGPTSSFSSKIRFDGFPTISLPSFKVLAAGDAAASAMLLT